MAKKGGLLMIYDITYVVTAIVELIGAILFVTVVPILKDYLKQKYNQDEINGMENAIETAVKAAEQIYKSVPKSGNAKKDYVLEILKEQGYAINTKEVDAMIESKVMELYGEVFA